MEPYSLPPRDTPEQNRVPSRTGEAERWVKGFRSIAMDRGSGERFMSQVRENASSVLALVRLWKEYDKEIELNNLSVRKQMLEIQKKEGRVRVVEERQRKFEDSMIERLSSLEEKEKESDVKQFLEVNVMRLVLEMQNEQVFGLAQDSMVKKHEELMREVEARKEEVAEISLKELETRKKDLSLLNEIIKGKSIELEKKEEKFQLKEKELSLLNESIKDKSIELEKKEENFQQKQRAGAKEIEAKSKLIELKEKEIEEKMKQLQLKQIELEERSIEAETSKRSRLEFESSLLAEKDRGADSISPIGKKRKPIGERNINDEERETELALVLYGETSSDPAAEQTNEAKGREVDEIVCRDEVDEDHEPCPEPDFSDFSNTIDSFSLDQVWALYDPIDAMPRYYARIRKIIKPQLSMKVTWLESLHNTANQQLIPIACGKFRHGSSDTKSLSMFSHVMHRDIFGRTVMINPSKGETWAVFRDWTQAWNIDREQHKPPYRCDFVEVVSEFDKVHGIGVAYLGRVEGFTSVYERAEQHGLVQMMISPDEMFRFSHRVPSCIMTGDEKDGVPAGSFELDPAAIPRSLFVARKEESIVVV